MNFQACYAKMKKVGIIEWGWISLKLYYGVPEDIEKWMDLVVRVRWNFPGLETQEKLDEHRRRGVATTLMDEALRNLDHTKEITVSTFRAEDEKGLAPRALYEKYGFVPRELTMEMNYPNQRYVLSPCVSKCKS